MIPQISVFIQNDEGRLAHVLRVLKQADINIRSLTISETADYGIMRLILQDPEKGLQALKDAHIMANQTTVLAVELPDRPGGMSQLTEILAQESIPVEYAYSFLPQNTSNAIIIFNTKEEDKPRVAEVLKDHPALHLLDNDDLLLK